MSSTKNELQLHALRYIEANLSVIPIRADGSKAPAIAEWKPYQSQLADSETLRAWFGNGRRCGIAAGERSKR